MEINLKPVYDPHEVEDKIYRFWLDKNCFRAGKNPHDKSFTIVIPPPNVTGSLHMGACTGQYDPGCAHQMEKDAGL